MTTDATNRQAAVGTPAGTARSVGQMLKAARVARDLTLDQISTELRIEAPQLQALEQDQFERIGAPVFVKGYLRHYGALLGLDAGVLLGLYTQQVATQHDVIVQPSRSIHLRDERQITVWIVAAAVLVVLAGLMVWWVTESGVLGSVTGTDIPAADTSSVPADSDDAGAGAPARSPQTPPED